MMAQPESDEVLVKRLLPSSNGNSLSRAVAWREWYTQVGEASVLAFIKAQNDTSEPDMDIFQETMLTAFVEVERGRYRPHLNVPFAAYVKGIARNKIREARRRGRRFIPLDDMPQSEIESDEHLEAVVEQQEQQDSLHASLAELSQSRRQVLEGYLRGNSTTEIAQSLGITEELVRQHKSRGVRSLRQMAVLAV
ncbi:MAG: sigma-70 family RNA polymerase sigma factor [Anaerolineae bacterium]|nr:sigma-70 family RNA polymerase sigma factor [Anaerolineae bacterium]